MTPPKHKEKYVPPVFLRKLREKMKTQDEIGKAVGVTASHVCACLRDHDPAPTSLTIELAAQQVFEKRWGGANGQVVIVASVSSTLADIIETVIKAHDGKYQIIK